MAEPQFEQHLPRIVESAQGEQRVRASRRECGKLRGHAMTAHEHRVHRALGEGSLHRGGLRQAEDRFGAGAQQLAAKQSRQVEARNPARCGDA